MISLNLEALGVTEEALEKSILSTLGLNREQAVTALAEKFGVSISTGNAGAISTGDEVLTSQGPSVAAVLTTAEIATLKEAASISQRIFS